VGVEDVQPDGRVLTLIEEKKGKRIRQEPIPTKKRREKAHFVY